MIRHRLSASKMAAKKCVPKKSGLWLKLTVFVLFVGLAAVAGICAVYSYWAGRFDIRDVANITERSAVYDMDGRFYSRLAGENRINIGIDDVSASFKNALLAREDTRFYKHHGIDPIGISRAIFR